MGNADSRNLYPGLCSENLYRLNEKRSRRPLLEDPEGPVFYEMVVFRKELVETQSVVRSSMNRHLSWSRRIRNSTIADIDRTWSDVMETFKELGGRSTTGADERIRITPCTSQPYQWIVSLLIKFPRSNGPLCRGTGSIVQIGDCNRIVILTCAHNLYDPGKGGRATEVTIVPGRDGVGAPFGKHKVTTQDLMVPTEYEMARDKDYDYAAIFLKASAANKFGFGYTALSDEQMKGLCVETAGYAGDKPDGTLWLSGGIVTEIDRAIMIYTNGGGSGSSGAPVWTWASCNFMLVGIHGQACGSTNFSCRRIDATLIDRVVEWCDAFR